MSLNVLSIETATSLCSVALLMGENQLSFREIPAPQQHSQLILTLLEALLAEAGLELAQVDILAFSRGPGSFTGVRLGLNVIQGIALAWDLPIVPVSTLRALAQGAYRTHRHTHVLAALDARLNQVYWGSYQLNEQHVMGECDTESVNDPNELPIASIQAQSSSYVGIGSGWDRYSLLSENTDMSWIAEAAPHAQDIAHLAYYDYHQGVQFRADTLTPHYVRNQVAQPKSLI